MNAADSDTLGYPWEGKRGDKLKDEAMELQARRMDWGSRLICAWPGLPGLWYRGQFSSLLLAVGFSILLNLALVSSFLWPRCLGETFPVVAWPTVLILWMTAVYVAVTTLPDVLAVGTTAKVTTDAVDVVVSDTLFINAQREYLGGHWSEAESMLQQQLKQTPRDQEARLLLATLLRHERRLDESAEQLDTMLKFDSSAAWDFEIDRERKLLELIAEHDAEVENVSLAGAATEALLPDNNDGYIQVEAAESFDM